VKTAEDVRFKLDIHYDGTRFFGWQIQKQQRTVQGEIEAALERLTQAHRTLTGSGRTDRGVHATGQVASVKVPARWTAAELKKALNAVLPSDIWIPHVMHVPDAFHPRYDAVARTYHYRVGTVPRARSPFERPWCWALDDEELDLAAMEEGAAHIPGHHSFKSFAKSGQPQRGEMCTVTAAGWSGWSDLGLEFEITANRYLHHMVRYLVGTLVDVGRGRRPPDVVERLLEEPDGELVTSRPAPARGLFLTRVEYDPESLSFDPSATEEAESTT